MSTYPPSSPLFSCAHITRYYDNKAVIEDISLSLEKGELVSLIGPSGVGKTTLFNILAGVDTPDCGSVQLEGKDITGKPGQVGYMLQKDLLLPYKTTLDNVSLPLLLAGQTKSRAREQAAEYLPQFGLAAYGDHYPHQLSGGMRQRAALLRTFLMGSPITLLDEPFSALDALTKRDMHLWYLALAKETQMTTVFITHDIDEALLLSHRVYVMTGTPGQLVRQFLIAPDDRSDPYFVTSPSFLAYKREILQTIQP